MNNAGSEQVKTAQTLMSDFDALKQSMKSIEGQTASNVDAKTADSQPTAASKASDDKTTQTAVLFMANSPSGASRCYDAPSR